MVVVTDLCSDDDDDNRVVEVRAVEVVPLEVMVEDLLPPVQLGRALYLMLLRLLSLGEAQMTPPTPTRGPFCRQKVERSRPLQGGRTSERSRLLGVSLRQLLPPPSSEWKFDDPYVWLQSSSCCSPPPPPPPPFFEALFFSFCLLFFFFPSRF